MKRKILICLILVQLLSSFSNTTLSQNRRPFKDLLEQLENHKYQDSTRFVILDQLTFQYLMSGSLDLALHYNMEALELSKNLNNKVLLNKAYLHRSSIYMEKKDHVRGQKFADEALLVIQDHKESIQEIEPKIKTLMFLARVCFTNNKANLSIKHCLNALKLANDLDPSVNPMMLSTIYRDAAVIFSGTGYFINWHNLIQKSITICKKFELQDPLAINYNLIGSHYLEIDSHESALKYFEKAISLDREKLSPLTYGLTKNFLGITYLRLNHFEKSLALLQEANTIFKNHNLLNGLDLNYIHLGEYYLKKEAFKTGLMYLDKALIRAEKNKAPDLYITTGLIKAEHFKSQKEYTKALKILHKTETYLDSTAYKQQNIEVYKNLALIYNEVGDTDQIIATNKKYIELQETKRIKENNYKAHTLNVIWEHEQVKNNLAKKKEALQRNQEKQQTQNTLIGLITAIFLLIIIGLAHAFVKTKKINRLKEQHLKAQKALDTINQNRIKEEIEFKNQQLTNYAIHIEENNNLLSFLKNELVSNMKSDRINRNSIQDILRIIHDNIDQNNNKIKFYSDIDQSLQSFFYRLSKSYPTLSTNEQRVIYLIRSGKSSKQIAESMDMSMSSINNYRTSIRKKLNLDQAVNLASFVMNI